MSVGVVSRGRSPSCDSDLRVQAELRETDEPMSSVYRLLQTDGLQLDNTHCTHEIREVLTAGNLSVFVRMNTHLSQNALLSNFIRKMAKLNNTPPTRHPTIFSLHSLNTLLFIFKQATVK